MAPTPSDDTAALLKSLPLWLDRMSLFIKMSHSQWRNAPAGYHLMCQRLAKHTLDLKAHLLAINSAAEAETAARPRRPADGDA